MRLGPHLNKESNLNDQRAIAKIRGWGAIQTNWGNVQSFGIANDFATQQYNGDDYGVFWSVHCPYVLTMSPRPENREGAASFLSQIIRIAGGWEIDCLVIHAGTVVGIPVEQAIKGIIDFIENNSFLEKLERAGTRIAIEFGASVAGLNLYPERLARELWNRYSGMIGYCLDTAHFGAAGVSYETIMNLVGIFPPIVSHVNFPGSAPGSSQDIHSWRTHPHLEKRKRLMGIRDEETIKTLCENHDSLLRLFARKDVPMVVEGASIGDGNVHTEIELIKQIMICKQNEENGLDKPRNL